MKFPLFSILAMLGSAVAYNNNKMRIPETLDAIFATASDAVAPTPVLVATHNYSIETHHVVTADGYILEMHRIPGSPTYPSAYGKPIVFLMHGLLCSSADWVLMGPGKSFGYILADAGYDVWMGNARGNTYSRNHISPISRKEFWAFSWHEIGVYDLPAMIDYALKTTGQRKIIYVGHSQGSTSFFVMTSQKTDYNDKIQVMFSLAPAAYMGHIFNPLLRAVAIGSNTFAELSDLFGLYEFVPSTQWIGKASATFCGNDVLSQFVCSNIIFILGGYNKAQLNISMLPTIFGHFPASASLRQLLHYGQEIYSQKFSQYDFGPIKNLAIYGSVAPPDYDLKLITAPVHVMYGANDWLVAVKDVAQLYNELGNSIEMRQVPDENWTHFDYIWGTHAKELVYDPILAKLRKMYNNYFLRRYPTIR